MDDSTPEKTASLGVYMRGLTLHNAGWSREHARLCPTESSEETFDNTVTDCSRIQTPSVTRFSTPLYADTSCGILNSDNVLCHLGLASEKCDYVRPT